MGILKTGKTIGVCVHHSVYKPANNITELQAQAKLFDGWHKSKSWAETIKTTGEFGYQYIEYHYLMALDGSILQVQDEKYVLYHSGDSFRGELSFNLHGIAICLTGNYETDKPTEAQMKSLVKFIRDIQSKYKIDALVRGHKETSKTATACPGLNIGTSKSGWLKQVIDNTNDNNYPPIVVDPPEPPQQTEDQKEIDRLKLEIRGLRGELQASQGEKKGLAEQIQLLTLKVEEIEPERQELYKEISALEQKVDDLSSERLVLQEENSKLLIRLESQRTSFIRNLIDWITKWMQK